MTITATYVRQIDKTNLGDPWGVAVDPSTGDLLVVNDKSVNPSLRRYTADGTPVTTTTLSSFEEYSGVAVSEDGATIWITNYYGGSSKPRLEKRSSTGTLQASYFQGAFPTPEIEGPTDVHVGPDGKVYVVSDYYDTYSDPDVYKQKVVRLATDGTLEATIGTNATLDGGSPSVFPEPQVDGEFAYPVGVAVDADGNVYVSDVHQPYRSIQKFSSDGTHLLTFGGPGTGDGQFSTSEYAITGWHEDGMKLAFNADWRLFATDRYGQRVNIYDTAGTPLGSFGTADTPNGEMQYPVAVACGPDGAVYVSDYYGGVTQWLVEEDAGSSLRGVSVTVCGGADC